MKLFQKAKDGGPESPVDAYFICEFKSLFSIAFLKFNEGSREKYHTHAFNALTWFLKGDLLERRFERIDGEDWIYTSAYRRSLLPKFTARDNLHRVVAKKTSWCFTVRGPWCKTWTEYDEKTKKTTTLTHGRKVV